MILKNKNAVIYGAGGAIGSAVARAFARQGAKMFLTGHSHDSLEIVAEAITMEGGLVEVDVVDATSEHDVNKHFRRMLEKVEKIDISFNAISTPQTGVQGIPLLKLSPEGFTFPINFYAFSHFLTAKAAGEHMVGNGAGVIITLTATPAKMAAPLVGGMAAAWSVIESLTRTLAGELGPYGVRVVCLRPDGIPETDTITEVFGLHAQAYGMPSNKEFQSLMESMTVLKRLPNLAEVANTAAFIASDQASAITGTVINLSCGSIVD
ncbi:MAG: SDR family NAD(P)-dependent oxidoreductase [Sphingobacteriales bacterium]